MQTVIYISDTAPLQNDVLFAALYQTLPDYRRRKIDRYLVAGAKRLSLGVGILLKAACFEQGIPGADNDIVFGEQGKGYFKNVRNVFFNLSHSGERAMCVIAPVETGSFIVLPKQKEGSSTTLLGFAFILFSLFVLYPNI